MATYDLLRSLRRHDFPSASSSFLGAPLFSLSQSFLQKFFFLFGTVLDSFWWPFLVLVSGLLHCVFYVVITHEIWRMTLIFQMGTISSHWVGSLHQPELRYLILVKLFPPLIRSYNYTFAEMILNNTFKRRLRKIGEPCVSLMPKQIVECISYWKPGGPCLCAPRFAWTQLVITSHFRLSLA